MHQLKSHSRSSFLNRNEGEGGVFLPDPYAQETKCRVANCSLLSYLYGSNEAFINSRVPCQTCPAVKKHVPCGVSESKSYRKVGTICGGRNTLVEAGAIGIAAEHRERVAAEDELIPEMTGKKERECLTPLLSQIEHDSPFTLDWKISSSSEEKKCSTTLKSHEFSLEGIKRFNDEIHEERTVFYKQLEEVRHRVQEQLYVHRELDAALRQAELAEEEVNIFRSTHEIGAFLSSLRGDGNLIKNRGELEPDEIAFLARTKCTSILEKKWLPHDREEVSKSVVHKYPLATNPDGRRDGINNQDVYGFNNEGNQSSPSSQNYFTEHLERFQKRKYLATQSQQSSNVGTNPCPISHLRKTPIEVCRSDPNPVPYRRVVYVPDSLPFSSTHSEEEREKLKRNSSSPLQAVSFPSTVESTTSDKKEMSRHSNYTEDFTSIISSIPSSITRRSSIAVSEGSLEIEEDISAVPSFRATTVSSSFLSTEYTSSIKRKGSDSFETNGSPNSVETERNSSVSDKFEKGRSIVRKGGLNDEILDEVDEANTSSSSGTLQTAIQGRKVQSSSDDTPAQFGDTFTDFLANFQKVCQQANELAFSLAQAGSIRPHSGAAMGGNVRLPSKDQIFFPSASPPLHNGLPSELQVEQIKTSQGVITGPKAQTVDKDWITSMTEDLRDIVKLKRFTSHLQKDLKMRDMHRKVRDTKRKILEKAQKLSRTRQQLQKNPGRRLREVLSSSEIEDLLTLHEDSVRVSNQEVEDEIESLVDFSQKNDAGRSSEESIVDDLSFSKEISDKNDSADVEDEVDIVSDTAFNSRGNRLVEHGADIIDDVLSITDLSEKLREASTFSEDFLDEIEDAFAEQLVLSSSLSDLMENIALPSTQSSLRASRNSVHDSLEISEKIHSRKESITTLISDEFEHQSEVVDGSLENSVLDDVVDTDNSSLKGRRAPDSKTKGAVLLRQQALPQAQKSETSSLTSNTSKASNNSSSHSSATDKKSSLSNSTTTHSSSTYSSDTSHSSVPEERSSDNSSIDTLAEDWALTQSRRRRALLKVRGELPTFRELYDPSVRSTDFSSTSSSSSFSSVS